MYTKAIVDELGIVVAWISGMSKEEIAKHLEEHPEHTIRCVYDED